MFLDVLNRLEMVSNRLEQPLLYNWHFDYLFSSNSVLGFFVCLLVCFCCNAKYNKKHTIANSKVLVIKMFKK